MSPLVESAARAAETPLRPLLAAVTVDLDRSVLIQVVLFSVLIVLLKPVLFDPMLRVFALREERTEGARAEARAMQERAAEILANYEKELAKIRVVAAEERDKVRSETAKLEASILEEAQQASTQILEEGRAKIAAELQGIRAELEKQSGALANDIARQVLGREVSQ
ncbi:MAG: ATP synthase F0 subunit B [Myxococcales bacterium]|jgi:F-type H+-transporting ATPase subunit b|nr:ATP synthase F0 subunit B [Myxococcales bacterium]